MRFEHSSSFIKVCSAVQWGKLRILLILLISLSTAIYLTLTVIGHNSLDTKKVSIHGIRWFYRSKMNYLLPSSKTCNEKAAQEVTTHDDMDQQSKTNLKIILYWNSWNPYMGNQPLIDGLCPTTACLFTSDHSLLNYSDVVLFFTTNETTLGSPFPTYRLPHQRFVFASHNTPQSFISEKHDFQSLFNDNRTRFDFFNWTMTYRWDSDLVIRLSMSVVASSLFHHSQFHQTKKDSKNVSPLRWMKRPSKMARIISRVGSKKKLVAWFPKSCITSTRREYFVQQLTQYIPVDVYGKCGNLSCGSDCSEARFKEICREYKFYLAFEEFWCPDYVTEEFYNALDCDTVPVVLGGADYDSLGPPHSFINALDFPSIKSLAEYLLFLDQNQELYAKYFSWKRTYQIVFQNFEVWCDLCRMSHDDTLPNKVYHDIKQWWVDDGKCENDSSLYF